MHFLGNNKNTRSGSCSASWQASAQDVQLLLRKAHTLKLSKKAKKRLQWFAYALNHDENISLTCRHFGIARSTFLRWAKRFDPSDPSTLEEFSRRPKRVCAPETAPEVVEFIRKYREETPTIGKKLLQEKLQEEHGVSISASTIGRVINRHCFFFADTPSHKQKRVNARIECTPEKTETHEEEQVTKSLSSGVAEAAGEIHATEAARADAEHSLREEIKITQKKKSPSDEE